MVSSSPMLQALIAAAIVAGLGAAQSQQVSQEEALAPVRRVFQLTREWDQATTAGMKAELKLAKKIERNGQSLFMYDLKITGAEHDQKYALVDWPLDSSKPFVKMDGLRVDDDGTVYCPANSNDSCTKHFAGDVLQLVYLPAKGEIFRSALISEDKQTQVFFSIVPDPIIVTDKACSIELVRLSRNFEMTIVRGKGFAPGEQLVFHAESYREVHDSETNADSSGGVYAELLPFLKGKKNGRTELTVRGKGCAPKLSFNWGKQD